MVNTYLPQEVLYIKNVPSKQVQVRDELDLGRQKKNKAHI